MKLEATSAEMDTAIRALFSWGEYRNQYFCSKKVRTESMAMLHLAFKWRKELMEHKKKRKAGKKWSPSDLSSKKNTANPGSIRTKGGPFKVRRSKTSEKRKPTPKRISERS